MKKSELIKSLLDHLIQYGDGEIVISIIVHDTGAVKLGNISYIFGFGNGKFGICVLEPQLKVQDEIR